jgi:hypothetical protein
MYRICLGHLEQISAALYTYNRDSESDSEMTRARVGIIGNLIEGSVGATLVFNANHATFSSAPSGPGGLNL